MCHRHKALLNRCWCHMSASPFSVVQRTTRLCRPCTRAFICNTVSRNPVDPRHNIYTIMCHPRSGCVALTPPTTRKSSLKFVVQRCLYIIRSLGMNVVEHKIIFGHIVQLIKVHGIVLKIPTTRIQHVRELRVKQINRGDRRPVDPSNGSERVVCAVSRCACTHPFIALARCVLL